MRKLGVLMSTMFACLCVGCSSDPNDRLIVNTMSIMNDTTRAIEQIKSDVVQAVEAAKKDNKPLSIEKIRAVATKAEELKKKAKELQMAKAETDVRKENVTAEQRQEYSDRHKGSFTRNLEELGKAQIELTAALKDAEAYNESLPDGEDRDNGAKELADLRKKLDESQREFEVLTRR